MERTEAHQGEHSLDGLRPMGPIHVPLSEFPRDEDVPEGCVVLEDIVPAAGYALDYREYVYRSADVGGGVKRDLKLYVLVPSLHSPLEPRRAEWKFPIVMYCQGSAWGRQWLYSHFVHQVELARRGFVVACVEYRTSTEAVFPAQAQDFAAAVDFVREHADELGADAERVALWGDSSGAHTSLTVGYAGDRLPGVGRSARCVVDWYGPTDLLAMGYYPSSSDHFTAECPEGLLVGGCSVLDVPELAAAASPVSYVEEGRPLPPTLIMHGGRDELVPFNQSRRLYERLRQTGNEVEFYKLPNANHGKKGFTDPRLLDIVERFLRKHLDEPAE